MNNTIIGKVCLMMMQIMENSDHALIPKLIATFPNHFQLLN